MKRSSMFFALMVVAGVLTGAVLSQMRSTGDQSYCQRLEDDIRQNQSFNGTIACYPPGVLDVNLSEEVENRTELKCVCRRVYNDQVQIFPVTVPG